MIAMDSNDISKIEENINRVNEFFGEIIKHDGKQDIDMLEFFRERYLHYLLFVALKEDEFKVVNEQGTVGKFARTGEKAVSGRFDLAILDGQSVPIIGIEFFLGWDVGYGKSLISSSFSEHLRKDYENLLSSNLKVSYILNYFYKGPTGRASDASTDRKMESYDQHFNNCRKACEELAKEHYEKYPDRELKILMVEARNDEIDSRKPIEFNTFKLVGE